MENKVTGPVVFDHRDEPSAAPGGPRGMSGFSPIAERRSPWQDQRITETSLPSFTDPADHPSTPKPSGRRRVERPLLRSDEGSILGGVCDGVARRLGLRTRSVRVIWSLLVLAYGVGAVAYMAVWMMVPRRGEATSIASRTVRDRRELQITLAIATLVLAILIGLEAVGLPVIGRIGWPIALTTLGGLIVWRKCSNEERLHLQELLNAAPVGGITSSKSWKVVALRATVGITLATVGVGLLSRNGSRSSAAAGALVGAVVLAAGFLTLFAPWWLRTLQELTSERRERVRAQERADMAAHLHDSVLQTLSLIQRAAHDPVEVARLARIQERDLRSWLFRPAASWTRAESPSTLVGAAADIERDVEDNYGVAVELVVVGDCPLDEPVSALLAAGREATINAAKWSRAESISVFIEVESDVVSMFVRDLGIGFELQTVPPDRHGIARSIVERMQRVGGNAAVRSTIGAGTEVEVTLPRQHRQP
jgi:signal transduction histidine kinase